MAMGSFGILKARWGILRSNSYYPIKTLNRFILGWCMLHNFIRANMDVMYLNHLMMLSHLQHGQVGEIIWSCGCSQITMEGNSDVNPVGRVRKRSIHNSRMVWTYAEETESINALKDLVVKGLNCDNGFKSGYLMIL
ncbi:hypothetical protein ACS0TY_030372 [Phlomoides rotata]